MDEHMSNFLKLITFASLVAFGSMAFAQDTTPPEATSEGETAATTESETPTTDGTTEATDEETTTTDDNILGLEMGEEVVDENAPGTTYIREKHGDWELRCIRVEEGKQEPCQLYQLLRDDNGNGVAEINLFNLPKGQQAAAGATIVTPLETLLTQQLTLAVDGGPTKRFPFTWCSAVGCFARIGFSNGDIASFKRGSKAAITIVPVAAPDQKVTLTISLTGFTKGYESVVAANGTE